MLRSNRSQRSNRCFTIFSDPIAVDSLSEIIFLCDRIAVSDPIAVLMVFSDPIAVDSLSAVHACNTFHFHVADLTVSDD